MHPQVLYKFCSQNASADFMGFLRMLIQKRSVSSKTPVFFKDSHFYFLFRVHKLRIMIKIIFISWCVLWLLLLLLLLLLLFHKRIYNDSYHMGEKEIIDQKTEWCSCNPWKPDVNTSYLFLIQISIQKSKTLHWIDWPLWWINIFPFVTHCALSAPPFLKILYVDAL